jgi:tryptophan synthase alpha chain
MSRIESRFRRLEEMRQAAFIPFIPAGDPDLETTLAVLAGAEEAGADVIELGFPFSDSIADGPTIQDSYHRALTAGVKSNDVFRVAREARRNSPVPIVAMVSYSIVYRLGVEAFLDRAADCGMDGATIPDLPIEEAEPLLAPAGERDFRIICFATPATTGARRALVARQARGFIYYISVRGITGERTDVPTDLCDNIRQLKALTPMPVAVGFGISRPEHARAVAAVADGVIVGSAIVKRMRQAVEDGRDAAGAALDFIRSMSAAAKSASR